MGQNIKLISLHYPCNFFVILKLYQNFQLPWGKNLQYIIIYCQPIVIGINSAPIWGVLKKETLISPNSSIVTHNCENSPAVEQFDSASAQLWSSTAVEQHGCEAALGHGGLCSARLLHLCWPVLCQSLFLLCPPLLQWDFFSSSWEKAVSVFGRKGEYTLQAREESAFIARSPNPWSLTGLSSCKWGLQIVTVWLVQQVLSSFVRMESLWSKKMLMRL